MSNKPCPRTKNGFHPRSSASCSYCNPGGAGSSATVGVKPLGMDLLHPGSGQPNGTAAEALEFVEKMVKPDSLPEGFNSQTVVDNAHRIYDWMRDNDIAVDSVTRESMFDYAAKDTGRDYEELFEAWMSGTPLTDGPASAKADESALEGQIDQLAEHMLNALSENERQALMSKARAVKDVFPQRLPDDLNGQMVLDNAHRIYDWMSDNGVDENPSAREALFDYAARETGVSRDDLTMAWLKRLPLGQEPVPGEVVRNVSFDGSETDSKATQIEKALIVAAIAAKPAELPEGLTGQTVVDNAHRIYDWMRDNGIAEDSWTRECMFDYAAKDTGRDYEELYNAWLYKEPVVVESAVDEAEKDALAERIAKQTEKFAPSEDERQALLKRVRSIMDDSRD